MRNKRVGPELRGFSRSCYRGKLGHSDIKRDEWVERGRPELKEERRAKRAVQREGAGAREDLRVCKRRIKRRT
jgi:type III secretory pathway component EscU